MKRRIIVSVLAYILLMGSNFEVFSQPTKYSTLNIEEYEQLYRVRVWRRIDLREKQNKGFFSTNREISRLILNGINSGEIDTLFTPFTDDLEEILTKENFQKSITITQGAKVLTYDAQTTYNFGEVVTYNGKKYESALDGNYGVLPNDPNLGPSYWTPNENAGEAVLYEPPAIAVIELMEDVIFDKRRSRLYFDPIAIKLTIPSDLQNEGQKVSIAYILYKDFVELCENHPNQALWINRYNPKEYKSFPEAFKLRLFSGTIVKYQNPDDLEIRDMFENNFEAVLEMRDFEMKMMEKEHNLWEY